MKIGIAVLIHEIIEAIEICKNIKNVNHIEIGIDNLEECNELLTYSKTLQELDISIGIHLPMEFNTCENIVYISNQWINYFKEMQFKLTNMNIEYFNLHPGYIMSSRLEKNRFKYLDNSVRFFDKLDNKIPVTIENTYSSVGDFSNIGNKVEDFEYIFSNIKNKNISFCYDTGHELINPSNYTEVLKDKIKVVHLSDNDGFRDSHIGIGKGILQESTLNRVFKIKPQYLILEIIYKDLEKSFEIIDKYLGKEV